MASISSLGVGSGLDIQGLVTSLVEAEGASKTSRLDRKQVEYEAKLSMYSTVKSALSDFRSAFSGLKNTSSFNVLAANISNNDVFSASVSSSADIANYDIEVTQLAQAQRLNSAGFADKNSTVVGTGTLVLNYGTYTYDGGGNPTAFTADADASTVKIDINGGTLEDIRDSINDAHAGVSANIVNDPVDGYKLVLTSDTGENNALNITWEARKDGSGNPIAGDDLSALAYDPNGTYGGTASLTETQNALSAKAAIDGVAITSESNTIKDAIDHVSLTLNGVSSEVESLGIVRSTSNVEEAVQSFVDGYNNLMATLNSASFYNQDTGDTGILIGDATVRGIVNEIRGVLNNTVNKDPTVQYNSLASLGILTARDGSLEYDSSKL
ncbi:MAG: flagellar filament capping protein FliD, partial [Gammaproteobacteria bacterium]|nr:flagellar filament capping protein FliD [Gammaproteobacteria bacterium]